MPDPIYADARLAAVYDAFEEDRDDLDAYVALTDECAAGRVIDLGCGTGSLALRLATGGRDVVGIDPACASLEVAGAKRHANRVTWLVGDAGAIPTVPPADLVLMTGNAAQAVLTDHAWALTLDHVRGALRPRGWFVFETRRPQRREWEDWKARPPETVVIPGVGTVERRLTVTAVELPFVSFRFTYGFPSGEPLVSDSTVRFRDRAEIETGLARHGFDVEEVRDAPDRPGRELVVLASRR